MKNWFVYLINGKKIGTWANNTDEAKRNLIAEYGNVPMKFLGINYDGFGEEPEEFCCNGMSTVDKLIAYGVVHIFTGLRWQK